MRNVTSGRYDLKNGGSRSPTIPVPPRATRPPRQGRSLFVLDALFLSLSNYLVVLCCYCLPGEPVVVLLYNYCSARYRHDYLFPTL